MFIADVILGQLFCSPLFCTDALVIYELKLDKIMTYYLIKARYTNIIILSSEIKGLHNNSLSHKNRIDVVIYPWTVHVSE